MSFHPSVSFPGFAQTYNTIKTEYTVTSHTPTNHQSAQTPPSIFRFYNYNPHLNLPLSPHFLLNNGVLLLYSFLKPNSGLYFFHIQLYLAVNTPFQISTLVGILLLTASRMIRNTLKFTFSLLHLLIFLQGHRSVVFFYFDNLLFPQPHFLLQ